MTKHEGLNFDVDLAGFTPRQMDANAALDSGDYKYLLYGGCLGGGKSYFLRWYALRRLMTLFYEFGIRNAVGMLACEDYPALKDRQLSKIGIEFPNWIGKLHNDHKLYGRCFILRPEFGSGVIAFRNLDDTSKYQSAEFAFILVDELTKNTYDTFTFLRSRLRWPGLLDVECQFVGGTNPGSVGHGWVKGLWMDKAYGSEWKGYEHQFKYVPSKAKDNPYIDSSYYATLDTLPENLRKAFRDGDWDIFVGQAFSEWNKSYHVIAPREVPESAPLYFTFDWGFGKPFSVGWWWSDADGRLFRFGEWYGWNGSADVGLRITDTEIARGILKRELDLGISGRNITRLAGHDSWNKKPDYKGGGQGVSTAEKFAEYGLYLVKADSARHLKIRQFRERLRVDKDEKTGEIFTPMVQIYDTCTQFIRTIPNLVMDKNNIEDVDTKGEDHIYDEACQIFMFRPMSMQLDESTQHEVDLRLDELEKMMANDPYQQYEKDVVLGSLGYNWAQEDKPVDHGTICTVH